MTTEDGRRLRHWRLTMVVVCVPVSLFFALMLFGIGITIGDPDAWGPGDPEMVTTLTTLSAAVAVGTGMTAHRLGTRIDATADTTEWLPAANRPRGKAFRTGNAVSPAWIRRLRTRVVRAVLIGFAFVLAFAGGAWWMGELAGSADQLLRDGTRAPGYVTGAWTGKRDSFLTVQYFVGVVATSYTFRQDSDVSYVVGQPVTVFYDPADRTRIRTVEEKNIADGPSTGAGFTVMAGLAGITWSAILVAGWGSRYRRTRMTGWHEASAVQAARIQPRSRMLLVIRFTDRSRITLRPTASSLYAASQATGGRPVTAFVSGTGRAMTVLVPREGKRPWMIAVKALDRRS